MNDQYGAAGPAPGSSAHRIDDVAGPAGRSAVVLGGPAALAASAAIFAEQA